MTVLVTGGLGYIGSHTVVELLNSGYEVIVIDNLYNSYPEVEDRIKEITGKDFTFIKCDILDRAALDLVTSKRKIDCCIHFAGLKAVGESVQKPLLYYENNITGTINLVNSLTENGCKKIIFSSSATVYGEENDIPYIETMKKGTCSSPYGWTKSMIEQILTDANTADPELSVVLLRYFNPIGAHPSGRIGEDPQGIPNNLMPYISQVAVGRRDHLTIFGNDYKTPDGTCRRDYIHVVDLAEGHVKAVEYAAKNKGTSIFNLGTGTPYSVLEIVNAFEKANGIEVKYEFGARRAGDLPEFWANSDKAQKELGWTAKKNLEDMCRDSWNWQKNNPNGYRED